MIDINKRAVHLCKMNINVRRNIIQREEDDEKIYIKAYIVNRTKSKVQTFRNGGTLYFKKVIKR